MKNIKSSYILCAIGSALLVSAFLPTILLLMFSVASLAAAVYTEIAPSDKEGVENGSSSESA